ncbi:hypothetical protein [Pseudomonas chlororaphis]|uniref:hypothetical protein n=1 Tax=Pseudomonas chlororaphis TaxID=587753 RepID=UPI0015DE66DB|nr:hypothetical protein [Pseudomonas chlororaphis]QLL10865.1 hypothetical protein H0I86_17550 [Pseudomonas chlororaphis subsp. aurantiaca]
MNNIKTFIATLLLMLGLSACTSGVSSTTTYPTLKLYGPAANLLCEVAMSSGETLLPQRCGTKNYLYYFTIENPKEGVSFSFHTPTPNNCLFCRASVNYKVRDPIYGSSTKLMAINAGATLPLSGNVEIFRGVWTDVRVAPDTPAAALGPFMYVKISNNN